MKKNRFHVYTPFYRQQNLPALEAMMADCMGHTFDGTMSWTLICEEKDVPKSFCLPSIMVCPPVQPPWHPAGWKDNFFLDHEKIEDRTFYLHLSDDDWYEPDFFSKVDAVDGDVLIVTMKNGPTPEGRRLDLVACQDNLRGAGVGGQQIIVRGSIIREGFRFGPSYSGDWDFISDVTSKHPPVYVPNAAVFWNKLS